MAQEGGETMLSPEQAQTKDLTKREVSLGRYQRMVHRLLDVMPVGFAATDEGSNLMGALQEAEDKLTTSRSIIRGAVGGGRRNIVFKK